MTPATLHAAGVPTSGAWLITALLVVGVLFVCHEVVTQIGRKR